MFTARYGLGLVQVVAESECGASLHGYRMCSQAGCPLVNWDFGDSAVEGGYTLESASPEKQRGTRAMFTLTCNATFTVGGFSSWPNCHVVKCPLLLIQHIGNNSASLEAVPTKRNWRHALQYYSDSEETLHAIDRIKDMQWQHSFHNILPWMIQNIFTDHESWVVSSSALIF